MGKVKFFYGAMGSGKTTKMLAMFDTYNRRKKIRLLLNLVQMIEKENLQVGDQQNQEY